MKLTDLHTQQFKDKDKDRDKDKTSSSSRGEDGQQWVCLYRANDVEVAYAVTSTKNSDTKFCLTLRVTNQSQSKQGGGGVGVGVRLALPLPWSEQVQRVRGGGLEQGTPVALSSSGKRGVAPGDAASVAVEVELAGPLRAPVLLMCNIWQLLAVQRSP